MAVDLSTWESSSLANSTLQILVRMGTGGLPRKERYINEDYGWSGYARLDK